MNVNQGTPVVKTSVYHSLVSFWGFTLNKTYHWINVSLMSIILAKYELDKRSKLCAIFIVSNVNLTLNCHLCAYVHEKFRN